MSGLVDRASVLAALGAARAQADRNEGDDFVAGFDAACDYLVSAINALPKLQPWTREELIEAIARNVSVDEHSERRFGIGEVYEGYGNNREMLKGELNDLFAVVAMLGMADCLNHTAIEAKKAKVEKHLEYSRLCGVLTEPRP